MNAGIRTACSFGLVPFVTLILFIGLCAHVGSVGASLDYLLGKQISVSGPKITSLEKDARRLEFTLTNLSQTAWEVKLTKCSCSCITQHVPSQLAPLEPTAISFEIDTSDSNAEQGVCIVFVDTGERLAPLEFPMSRE
jgi:hypothetical protein